MEIRYEDLWWIQLVQQEEDFSDRDSQPLVSRDGKKEKGNAILVTGHESP
jgi:hypothetical protein